MVFDDVDRPAGRSKYTNQNHDVDASAFMASPIDRLAAFMADLVLFLPLATLCLAPLKKQALLAQIAGDSQKLILLGFAGSLIIGALLIAYQTFFIGTFGATPGKHFLGLRVVNIWDKQKPTYFAAFVRSIFWFLSLLVLGLPWLAIFSNSHRRPLHDRVADSLTVVRERSRAATSPGIMESSMINGLNAAVITFTLLVGSIFIRSYIHQNKEIADVLVSDKSPASQRCEQVTSAVGEWLGTESEPPNRMEIALALHAGERIDDDCLEAEATTNFLEEKHLELSYLAKAIIKRDNEDEFSDYMDKVCESDEQTPECALLEAVQSSEDKAVIVDLNAPTYLRLWAIRLNLDHGFPAEALVQLSIPAPHMDLAYYFARKRLQAKLDLNHENDISSEFTSALDGLNREERISLARETCLEETQLSCGNHFACQKLLDFTLAFKAENELSFENPTTVLAVSRAVRCENKSEIFDQFSGAVELASGRDLIQAEKLLANQKTAAAIKLLKSIAKQEDLIDIKAEAAALLLQVSNSNDLETVSNDWSELDRTSPSWRFLGWNLQKALMNKNDYSRALEVARQLKSSGLNSIELQKNMIVAAYESHHADEAKELLAEIGNRFDSVANLRAPASLQDGQISEDPKFKKVLELLRADKSQ